MTDDDLAAPRRATGARPRDGRMRVVLEGLTGTGKSQTLAAMARLGLTPARVVPEEETFGELMDEVAAAEARAGGPLDALAARRLLGRLDEVLDSVVRREDDFLLERFHLSYHAVFPPWERYAAIDAELAERGVELVLLCVPETALRERSLLRREHGGRDWQGLCAHYGSEAAAMNALRRSQERRIEALARSRMRSRVIDTSAMDWESTARQVAGAAG